MTSRSLLGGALTVNFRLCLRSSADDNPRWTVADDKPLVAVEAPALRVREEAGLEFAEDLNPALVCFLWRRRYRRVMKDIVEQG